MTKLSRKVEYSLMALRYLSSKPGQPVSAKEIAEHYSLPFDAVARVLQSLAHKSVVKSTQGAQGGYELAQSLEGLSFYQVIEIIEGPLGLVRCLYDSKSNCDLQSSCDVVGPLKKLNEKLTEFYKTIPVSELLVTQANEVRSEQ